MNLQPHVSTQTKINSKLISIKVRHEILNLPKENISKNPWKYWLVIKDFLKKVLIAQERTERINKWGAKIHRKWKKQSTK